MTLRMPAGLRRHPSTDTGLNENFDHVDLDVDLLILKRKVLPLSRRISIYKSFSFHCSDKM